MLESPSDLMQEPASDLPIALNRESLAAHVALRMAKIRALTLISTTLAPVTAINLSA